MKPILTSILFLLFITTTHAQKPSKLDSLKNVLAHLPAEGKSFAGDTLRVRVLCEMGEYGENPDSVIWYTKKSLYLGKKCSYSKCDLQNFINEASALKYNGLIYNAIDILTTAKLLAEKEKKYFYVGVIDRSIGNCYLWSKEYEFAQGHYLQAMKIFKKLSLFEEYADTQNNLAINYIKKKNYIKAIQLLNDCFKYLPYIKGDLSEINFTDNLSLAYSGLKNHKEAIRHSEIAINKYILLRKKKNVQLDLSRGYLMLSANQMNAEMTSEALENLQKAQDLNSNYSGNQIEINQLYYEIYKKKGNTSKALLYLENFREAENKKINIEQDKLTKAYKAVYDLDKEKIQVTLLNNTIEKKEILNKLWIGGLMLTLIFTSILFWGYLRIRKINKEIELQKQEITLLNSDLESKVLQRTHELSGVNKELIKKNFEITEALYKGQTIERKRVAADLHDNLGSTLSAIKWRLEALNPNGLTIKENIIYESIKVMMKDAYNDVRNISHNLYPSDFENIGLIKCLDKLCADINESKRIHISFTNTSEYEMIEKKVAFEIYSICMEMINNTLKHSEATNAQLDLTNNQNTFIVTMSDNGKGITDVDNNNGVGLKSFTERVVKLNGKVNFLKKMPQPFSIQICFVLHTSENGMWEV